MALRITPKKKGKVKNNRYGKSGKCPFCKASIDYIDYYVDSDMRLILDLKYETEVPESITCYKNVWHTCSYCGHPVNYPTEVNSSSDFLIIYMSVFYGWIGGGKKVCLVIDTKTSEAVCNILIYRGTEAYPIDDTFIMTLIKNKELLLEYQEKNYKEIIYDTNCYSFNIFYREKYNTASFQDPYINKHPLFKKLASNFLRKR